MLLTCVHKTAYFNINHKFNYLTLLRQTLSFEHNITSCVICHQLQRIIQLNPIIHCLSTQCSLIYVFNSIKYPKLPAAFKALNQDKLLNFYYILITSLNRKTKNKNNIGCQNCETAKVATPTEQIEHNI